MNNSNGLDPDLIVLGEEINISDVTFTIIHFSNWCQCLAFNLDYIRIQPRLNKIRSYHQLLGQNDVNPLQHEALLYCIILPDILLKEHQYYFTCIFIHADSGKNWQAQLSADFNFIRRFDTLYCSQS